MRSPVARAFPNEPMLGEVRHMPTDPVVAGSFGTWTTEIRVPVDLKAGAMVALARRWASDWGTPQWNEPTAENYTSVDCGDTATVELSINRIEAWHPWDHVLRIRVVDGQIRAGGRICICYGDLGGGGPGARAQTSIDESSSLSVRLAPTADAEWYELGRPTIRIVGGPAVRLLAVAPSRISVGEDFRVVVRAEDVWGNPATDISDVIRIAVQDGSVVREQVLDGSKASVPLRLDRPGIYRLDVAQARGTLHCESNPIECSNEPPALRTYWGDIHAQSSIGCGNRTLADYLTHARDVAALDFTSHQANDFMVTNEEWAETQEVIARFNKPGRFVTLLGIEWSGETRVGGDRNVYFSGDTGAIRRSSHRHLADRSDEDTDLPTVTALHRHYHNADVLLVPHVGGRTADLSAHDGNLERLIEIHSTHATSEWFLFEALQRGMRIGVTAGSDGVDGRPGNSHPGTMSIRNLQGGLVAANMPGLTRENLWQALKLRRCYATTGERILLDFDVSGHPMGAEGEVESLPLLRAVVRGTAPLEAVEFFRGATCIHSAALIDAAPTRPDLIRVAWRGATKPGNWRRARQVWDGNMELFDAKIQNASGYAFNTPAEGLRGVTESTVTWQSITAGDWDGVILEIDAAATASLRFRTKPAEFELALSELAEGPKTFGASGHNACVEVRCLPARPLPLSWECDFADQEATPGLHPYWLRVRQTDGAQAWCSPVYINVGDGR
jgi:Protein of unknown function (DUF3604)